MKPFKYRANLLNGNILHLEFDNIKDQTIALFRPSEYYESPHKAINGKVFSYEDFFVNYVKPNGEMTFFKDWPAFNIPGHVMLEFANLFPFKSNYEEHVYDLIYNNIDVKKPFYIISNIKGDIEGYEHELAHAIWYLNENYKDEMRNCFKVITPLVDRKVMDGFKEIGYPMKIKSIITDELQSWLATSTKQTFKDEFNLTMKEVGKIHKQFREVFDRYQAKIKRKKIC